MRHGFIVQGHCRFPAVVAIAATLMWMGSGCGNSGGVSGGVSGGSDGGNALTGDVLGFDGTISGKLKDSQSTRASSDGGAGQELPLTFDTENTCVRFKDLAGNDLLDTNGQPLPEVPVLPDGSFSAGGLPVGTDFAVCGDIGKDGTCEIESCVLIPADQEGGTRGELNDVLADPLTTAVLARLRELVDELGIDVGELPFSPASVAIRIVNAYINLFEESGIEHTITLDDILTLAPAELAELFVTFIPAGARTGMDIVEGNLKLSRAGEAEGLALAAAEVFLRAGFPVVDEPGPPDLSALGDLDGITIVSREELFPDMPGFEDFERLDLSGEFDGPFTIDGFEGFDDFGDFDPNDIPEDFIDQIPDDFLLDPAETTDDPGDHADFEDFEPTFYISAVVEPNRNFSNFEEGGGDGGLPQLPVMNDRILMEMARLHLAGKRVTIGDLYEQLTDLNTGLGARLTYFIDDPNFFGPPLTVFETADGNGKAVNMERFFFKIFESGFDDFDPESFEAREAELRRLLNDLIGDTIPPSFERLFAGFAGDRIEGIGELSNRIRQARAHLPFNRSGPSSFFVVADADPFRTGGTANPVTVDADVSADGVVPSIVYNTSGTGKFFLAFTGGTDGEGFVELILRESGHFLHGPRGPIRLNMNNGAIFQPINGAPFIDFVSESGTFFPGTHISIIRDEFVPDGEGHPDELLFVLATGNGPGSEPVRVDFDLATGIATFNPGGRNLLMFIEDSESTGLFALFNEDTGRPAGEEDPADFFDAPTDAPEGFEEFFNETDDFSEFDHFTDIEEFVDEFFDVPEGEEPPREGEEPPPEGEEPPPEGEEPPPDGEEPPPDEPVEPASFNENGFILITASEVRGLNLQAEFFTFIFGTEVPNGRYRPEDDPYFDDINGNDVHDDGEPTAAFRPTLFDSQDWRSTDIRLYYRRSDNGRSVTFEDVNFESDVPQTRDGVPLVARVYRPRLNAFRFGRPNTAINLLTAFAPPDFFNGTRGLSRDTAVDVFSAIAIVNLIMDQVFNVEADVDIDGLGPAPRERMLIDAHMFVAPLGDPFALLSKGLRERAFTVAPE